VVASVGYRLAPESRYPSQLDDCHAGIRWVHSRSDELGVDPGRIGVAGGSAGALLAAALALLCRDRGTVPLAFQMLVAPMLDDRQITCSSRWDVPTWDPTTNATAWRAYLGDRPDADVPAYAAPARATRLTDLPPTFISIGTVDLFLDEAIAYAHALMHARVPTELHVYPGGLHGFTNLAPAATVATRATRDEREWLRGALAMPRDVSA
jgi:triacylglycerol lipase